MTKGEIAGHMVVLLKFLINLQTDLHNGCIDCTPSMVHKGPFLSTSSTVFVRLFTVVNLTGEVLPQSSFNLRFPDGEGY